MTQKLYCPLCKKRVCEVSDTPNEKLYIELKCPNCRQIVKILCGGSAVNVNFPKF